MWIKAKLLAVLFLCITDLSHGQTKFLHGKVKDLSSGENLIGAYIQTTGKSTITNKYGFFSIGMDAQNSSLDVSVSMLGYEPLVKTFETSEIDSILIFELIEATYDLQEVTIHSDRIKETNTSIEKLSGKSIEQLPSFFGEKDLIKSLQLFSGVSSGSEGSSNLFVRGGTPDQNLNLLDDIPIYNINHLAGFVSVFNTDAINNVTLYKGNFPARYGGRLSSVIDIQMKEGDRKEKHLAAAIGPISGKFLMEGPIKSKMSYMISARRLWLDLITIPLSKILFNGTGLGYNFGDYNGKINYEISPTDHLYFSYYFGRDNLRFIGKGKSEGVESKSKFIQRWGNNAFGLRWNKIVGKESFVNTTFYHTQYIFKNSFTSSSYADDSPSDEQASSLSELTSGIKEFGLKSEWEWYPQSNLSIKPGAGVSHQSFRPGSYVFKSSFLGTDQVDTTYSNNTIASVQLFAYLDFLLHKDKYSVGVGVRTGKQIGINQSDLEYNFIEPRFTGTYHLNENTHIDIGYSVVSQFQQLLSKTGTGTPTDIWVPVTSSIKPGKSTQWTLSLSHHLEAPNLNFTLGVFHKELNNLIAFKEGASFFGQIGDWQEKVVTGGHGTTKGIEFSSKKTTGPVTGWISYTLLKADRQFDELNNGKSFPFRYDRRHEINIVAVHKLSELIDFSASWSYHSGDAITLANSKYPGFYSSDNPDEPFPYFSFQETAYVYGKRNSFRMKSFHRLDISISFLKKKTKGTRIWDISIINMYNRKNPYFYYYGNTFDDADNAKEKLLSLTLFPVLPSFTYKRTF